MGVCAGAEKTLEAVSGVGLENTLAAVDAAVEATAEGGVNVFICGGGGNAPIGVAAGGG